MTQHHRLATAFLCALCGSATTASAQDPAASSSPTPPTTPAPTPLPVESYKPEVVSVPDGANEQAFIWRRPSDVEYVFISGCGAGGDGDPSTTNRDLNMYIGGRGGRSSNYSTIIVGPLKGDTYQVSVKRGGAADATFVGSDLTVTFIGGNGSEAPLPEKPNSGSNGARSIFGMGGAVGRAGEAGNIATAACAGGGGAGVGTGKTGGTGGPGKVVIFPVPNLDRLFDVMGTLGVPPVPPQHAQTTAPAARSGPSSPAATGSEPLGGH